MCVRNCHHVKDYLYQVSPLFEVSHAGSSTLAPHKLGRLLSCGPNLL